MLRLVKTVRDIKLSKSKKEKGGLSNESKEVGLVAAVMVVGAPLTAWAIDVAGGDLYYNGGQTDTIVYSEIGRKAGISRNYMVKATVKVGGDTYTSGFKSNYAYKDAKRVWWANETSYYDYYPY
ncbi:hypothetical protein LI249_02325 [Dorea formicigenerans]|nr:MULTISPECIES: hypothetical protein [Bacillota]MCB6416419.1 hypothetical protein [Faecalimonas umbilicata]MCC3184544.1 hypothetical protein [[Clostridium] innocuum]MCB6265771.1 hypothetical protein [Longicatena sp. 210702-DFI.1.160]MCB6282003.1 hypothetical protein [Dorea formicigenerans]MCB6316392.1 hypothetical protein [Longicatena sp. 210702-DFI.1.100]